MIKDLLQEIQLPAYEFTDNPVPMDRLDYDDTLTKIIQQTSRFAGLVSIYSLNKAIYPGLGTLKLCYVLSDTVEDHAIRKGLTPTLRQFRKTSPLLDEIPYYCQTVFQHIDHIQPLQTLKMDYGQDIRFAVLTGGDRSFAYILALNDSLLSTPLTQLLPMLVDGLLSVKSAWKGIESTIELIFSFQKATGKALKEWQEFIDKAHTLGTQWFTMNLSRYQEIKQLVREAVVILFSMIDMFANHVQKDKLFFIQEGVVHATGQQKVSPPTEYKASFFTDTVKAIFIDNWTPELAFHKMVTLYKKTGGYCMYLPTLMSVPYAMYSKGTELHSQLVHKSFLIHGYSGNVSMPGVVDSRNRWLSQHLEFVMKFQDMIDYPVWLGYHLETPSKWIKWLDNHKQSQHEKWQHNQSLELARI